MFKLDHRSFITDILSVGVAFLTTTLLALAIGEFPKDILSAPLNIVVLALWELFMVELNRGRISKKLLQYMLSQRATRVSLLLLVVVGILLGTDTTPTPSSWFVVFSLLFILTHLGLVVLRGCKVGKTLRLGFTLNHLGLWLAITSLLFGAPDIKRSRVVVPPHRALCEGYNMQGEVVYLGYDIELQDFEVEYHSSGAPSSFEARIRVDDKVGSVRVNDPFRRSFSELIYLVSYEMEPEGGCRYALFEVVREPWYPITITGIVMLLAGAVLMFINGPKGCKE